MKTITYDETLWQLVPKEITSEMIDAMCQQLGFSGAAVSSAYYDALAAAPTPAQQPRQESEIAWLRVIDEAMPKNVEVLRIEKDRIWVNPAVTVDEVAKVFLGVIDEHLVTTYRRTWNEAIEAAAERVESDMHNYAEVIRRLKK